MRTRSDLPLRAIKALQEGIQNLHIYPDRTGIRLQNALEKFYQNELI